MLQCVVKKEVINFEDETIYDQEYVYELLDDDEITSEEAGFMEGYI